MSSRICIYNNSGIRLTEIDVNFTRSWVLNQYGSGSFDISVKDSKATQEFLQFGNLITAEHDKLPIWGGIIDTPRTWAPGMINVSCYSAKYILQTRLLENITYTGSPGDKFEKLIYSANKYKLALFSLGEIYRSGEASDIYEPFSKIYDQICNMSDLAGEDWIIVPKFSTNGVLTFECSWYKKLGMIKQNRLIEDTNIKLGNLLTEQGTIITHVLVYGSGATWASKNIWGIIDLKSPYGLRSAAYYMPNLTAANMGTIANQILNEVKNPRNTFQLTALDDLITPANSIYYHLRLGNTIPLDLYTVGFTEGSFGMSTTVRILGMQYSDEDNQLNLVCDEVIDG